MTHTAGQAPAPLPEEGRAIIPLTGTVRLRLAGTPGLSSAASRVEL